MHGGGNRIYVFHVIHSGLFAECGVLDSFQGLCDPVTRTLWSEDKDKDKDWQIGLRWQGHYVMHDVNEQWWGLNADTDLSLVRPELRLYSCCIQLSCPCSRVCVCLSCNVQNWYRCITCLVVVCFTRRSAVVVVWMYFSKLLARQLNELLLCLSDKNNK